jgi:eukaryotic-like serine/threonine-protein kinase
VVDEAPRVLAGRYEVGELIGRGGMAEVHIGHDNRLGRTVAIKILRSDLARDPSFQARFRREAQSAAALNHPAIVAVYDTGEDTFTEPSGAVSHVPFIVMEYVEGHTVRDILQNGNAVPIEEAVEITSGVLSALEYSHHAGIVHRDIKPANVMLTPTGAIKVMDFGIARALADSAATMTQTQAVIGTAQYLSPEQARGESVDARSDLYSTGCLLFELLTGRPPFTGDSPVSVAYQHVREQPVTPSSIASDVPEALDRVTLKALAKERTARYGSAAEFRSDLEAVIRGGSVNAPAIGAFAAVAADAASTQIMSNLPEEAAPSWAPVKDPDDPLADMEEEEEEKPKRRALMWTLIVIGILALAGIIAMIVTSGGDDTPVVENAQVPVLTGLTLDEIKAALKEEGFSEAPKVTKEASVEVKAGLFVSSDPVAGESVPIDTVIAVVISAGPDATTVPDVTNMSQENARQILTEAGLNIDNAVTTENSPNVQKDFVTRTSPAAGEAINEGDTVALVVSTGYVDLPDLTGLARADALAQLNALSLTATIEEVESDNTEDTVVTQSPNAGRVSQGSSVTINLAVPPVRVTVPDNLVGMTQSDAQVALAQTGFTNVQIALGQRDNKAESGRVEAVSPDPGTQVKPGDAVTIYISNGQNYVDPASVSPSTDSEKD